MSCIGLARIALGSPDWAAAWGSVDGYFRDKLRANELDDPVAWAGMRMGREGIILMISAMGILDARAERASVEVDWCMRLAATARPIGEAWVDGLARLPDVALASGQADIERKRKREEEESILLKLCRPEVLQKPIEWRGRRYRRQEVVNDPAAQKSAEAKARAKWAQKILNILMLADLPFGRECRERGWNHLSPEAGRCLRGLRPATLKKRASDLGPFLRYLWGTHAIRWPRDKDDVLEFFKVRHEEKAARSVFRTLILGLRFFEEAGEVALADKIATLDAVEGATKEFETRRAAQSEAEGAKGRRQAPQMLLVLLAAIENVVVDESIPIYIRGYAWYRLLRHWASMRFSDGCGLSPANLKMRSRGLFGLLSRTKTSGSDKLMSVLPIFVSDEAYVSREWLRTGFHIWENELVSARDFFLVLPNEDVSGHCGRRARYSDVQYLSKQLLASLRGADGEPLLLPPAIAFWTEHSDRTGLDSWLAALAVGSDKRRFVGRWAAQGAEDTYVRTATRIVENCQRVAARHAKLEFQHGPDFLGEEETISALDVFLKDQGVDDESIKEQLRRLTCADFALAPDPVACISPDGTVSVLAEPSASSAQNPSALPALADLELEAVAAEEEAGADEDLEDEFVKATNLKKLIEKAEEVIDEKPMGFVISKTRGGKCRRLHFVGGCFRVPGEHYRSFDSFGQDVPEQHLFDFRCRDCFPADKPSVQQQERQEEVSASDDGSSSSSSSSAAAGG